MLGHSHAWSGLATGTAAGIVMHAHPEVTATLAGLTACFALVPDLDSVGSCAGRSLGFASSAVAHVVRKVSGGHRHGSHTLLGVAVFTGLAAAACHYRHDPAGRWPLAFMLALALAAGASALHVHRVKLGRRRIGEHATEAAAIVLAGLMAWRGYGLPLVPLSCALGQLTHVAGDACTDEGVPALWPLVRGHQHLLPEPFSFTTSTKPERWVVAPALVLLTTGLALHAAGIPLPHIHP